jgi:hypothetical protein
VCERERARARERGREGERERERESIHYNLWVGGVYGSISFILGLFVIRFLKNVIKTLISISFGRRIN